MKGIAKRDIVRVQGQQQSQMADLVVSEEPLEIRLGFLKNGVRTQKSISVTMRTPGHDEELALGFLFTESIIAGAEQVTGFSRPSVRWKQAKENVLVVELADDVVLDLGRLERHFYTSSSCGVCGKASIEAVRVQGRFELPAAVPMFSAEVLHAVPDLLASRQSIFDCTGGLHGAALFDASGQLLLSREDVGRHNALDKLIGAAMRQGLLPLSQCLVLVSGRAGFELVQKSVIAGAAVLAAVGAPTSLSVELAEEADMTLVGFLRNGQFNIYSAAERISF
ncbi:MAG: formate dehydrogenase accessory sulfurtransferase FdhD [Saprospiraceae bacterium]|nr:formate dehydrogenase accessory sulfurtransferase FdhD [Saprospiraceae bacterium]MCF8249400.1 formate dehydrogenase accessory sulfurtransferase FdhD [Saprospiraceae bacterium]MCF8279054.1 formate dehydrogenase accessory sulfurtransferase FdhD [Bacteroidales bacterium]MCF8311529.1 formate dehydrogenase accessory sulfurtransferase FdhD [Saprospiraceae bacterium]MCF8440019.1 formate dehydrogenase accessory sulfurtransferase FdhD [Saprospiraceae bacterium]